MQRGLWAVSSDHAAKVVCILVGVKRREEASMQLENEWVSNSVSIVWSAICDVRGRA